MRKVASAGLFWRVVQLSKLHRWRVIAVAVDVVVVPVVFSLSPVCPILAAAHATG